jgi:hypothetical protein
LSVTVPEKLPVACPQTAGENKTAAIAITKVEHNLLLIFDTPPGTPRLCYLAVALESPGPVLLRLQQILDVSESPYSRKKLWPNKTKL